MDPFVLSRNAFNLYCSEYINANSSDRINYERAIRSLNQRYEYFLQTLDRLQTSTRDYNMNSISSKLSSVRSKRKKKKLNEKRMPKIYITVSCSEHQTKQQPNIILN